MIMPRPSWQRVGGALVAVVLATSAAMPSVAFAEASPDKSETVHVQTDASGNVTSISVDELLANDAGTERLTDLTTLTDIEPVDDDQGYTAGKDGSLTWTTGGEQVSYRGTSTAKPPVAVDVSYTLDGKPCSPEELAGASGHLDIRIDYRRMPDEAGTDGGVGTPFVCMTVAMLDGEVFSNVEVTNGRVIEDKGGLAVVGLAFPGLADDLDLDDLGMDLSLDLSDYLEISADVKDLALDPIYTVVTPELFTELDVDELGLELDDIYEGSDALEEAMAALVEGTGSLTDALGLLATGGEAVSGGAQALRDALGALPTGASALSSGAHELADGLATAQEPVGLLVEGADQLSSGIEGVQGLVGAAQGSVQAAASAVEAVGAAASTLTADAGPLATAGAAMADGQAAAEHASGALVSLSEGLKGWDVPVTSALEGVAAETAEAQVHVDAASSDVASAAAAVEVLAGIPTESLTPEQQQALATAQASLASAQGQLAETTGDLTGASAARAAASDAVAAVAIAPPEGLADDIARLDASAAALASAKGDIDAAASGLATAGSAAEALTGADGALAQAQGALSSLVEGATRESGGLSSLASALAQAQQGAQALADGADRLAGSAPQLVEGANQLAEGSAQLTSALRATSEGSSLLYEGVRTFDNEGIRELTGELRSMGDDMGTLQDRLDALRASARAYDSFAGKAEGQSGSVRFIYKTARIG